MAEHSDSAVGIPTEPDDGADQSARSAVLIISDDEEARAVKREGFSGDDFYKETVLIVAESGEFDVDYYLASNLDVQEDGIDPILHYLKHGAGEGRRPNAIFDPDEYLLLNTDVDLHSIDPFIHFVTTGKRQRRPFRTGGERKYDISLRRLLSPHFDYDLYDARYPEAASAGVDALTHFLETGWQHGADPSARFSTRDYGDANPDVVKAGLNPIIHYIQNGRQEGRSIKQPLASLRQIIMKATSTLERSNASEAYRQLRSPTPPDRMERILTALIPRHRGILVISISHDDYVLNVGGVQSCVRREQVLVNEQDITYVHLAPAHPTLVFYSSRRPGELTTVTIDGERVGHVESCELVEALARALEGRQFTSISMVVHSFLGHSKDLITELHDRLQVGSTAIWIHDCSTLCSNFALLRNDAEFCWSPAIGSWSCRVCVYGSERKSHLLNVKALFESLNPTIVFPSAAMRDLWIARDYYTYGEVMVLPHAQPSFEDIKIRKIDHPKINIAFVGAPAGHKGWHEYRDIARNLWGDKRYSFMHFGTNATDEPHIRYVPVTVSNIEKNEMVAALQEHEVEVVVQWTLCFETFSFSTLEAVVAGCYVLARVDSGNAAAIVEMTGAGQIVADIAELLRLFQSGDVERLVEQRRESSVAIGKLQTSGNVAYLFDAETARG